MSQASGSPSGSGIFGARNATRVELAFSIRPCLAAVAENWRIDRMAAIDRNILRLGAFEILQCPEIPSKVAINEALELAKRYSTAQSSRFVNGILDRLQAQSAKEEENPAATTLEEPTEADGNPEVSAESSEGETDKPETSD